MTDDASQAALRTCATGLLTHLRNAAAALHPVGDTEHLQHREFGWRARLLATYLEEAIRTGESNAYPAAFALLRAGLEHRAFDRLLFLASVHEQILEGVTDDVWARWQSKPPEYLDRWERLHGDRVRVVWKGPRVVDDKGRTVHLLSVYYRWWKNYAPFAVPPSQFDHIATGHPSRRAEHAAYVGTQREVWQTALTWRRRGLRRQLPNVRLALRAACHAGSLLLAVRTEARNSKWFSWPVSRAMVSDLVES